MFPKCWWVHAHLFNPNHLMIKTHISVLHCPPTMTRAVPFEAINWNYNYSVQSHDRKRPLHQRAISRVTTRRRSLVTRSSLSDKQYSTRFWVTTEKNFWIWCNFIWNLQCFWRCCPAISSLGGAGPNNMLNVFSKTCLLTWVDELKHKSETKTEHTKHLITYQEILHGTLSVTEIISNSHRF